MVVSTVKSIIDFLDYWKMQFLIAGAYYVLDPEEKIILGIILFSILTLFGYTIFTYLPGHIVMIVSALSDVISGNEHELQG